MCIRDRLIGVCITLAGIAIIGYAGSLRSKNMTEEEKRQSFTMKQVFSGKQSREDVYKRQFIDSVMSSFILYNSKGASFLIVTTFQSPLRAARCFPGNSQDVYKRQI